jgi:hypothetical protein
MNENMNFPIPNSVLEPYIKQAVSTSIIAALGDGAKLIEQAVQSALSHKVDLSGKVSTCKSENTYHLVDIIARNKIKEIATEVIKEMAESMRNPIETKVRELIVSRKDEVAKILVNGLINSLEASWNIQVNITPPKERY